MQSSILV